MRVTEVHLLRYRRCYVVLHALAQRQFFAYLGLCHLLLCELHQPNWGVLLRNRQLGQLPQSPATISIGNHCVGDFVGGHLRLGRSIGPYQLSYKRPQLEWRQGAPCEGAGPKCELSATRSFRWDWWGGSMDKSVAAMLEVGTPTCFFFPSNPRDITRSCPSSRSQSWSK